MLAEGIYEANDVTEMSVRLFCLKQKKEMSLFLMKEMPNKPLEGWDFELIADVMKKINNE